MCYLLSWLNRRVRNRTRGGVRGRENLFNFPSYSIAQKYKMEGLRMELVIIIRIAAEKLIEIITGKH